MTDDRKTAHRKRVEELNMTPTTPISAIRHMCFACQGNSWHAVSNCQDTSCALWPFHLGFNPFRKQQAVRTIVITNLSKNQKGTGDSPGVNHQDAKTTRKKGNNTAGRRMIVFEGDIAAITDKLDFIAEKLSGGDKK